MASRGTYVLPVLMLIGGTFSEAQADNRAAPDLRVTVSPAAGDGYLLTGEFTVEASPQIVWSALTDYDRMADFVSSIRSSRRTSGEDGRLRVDQVMSGRAGFLRKRVHIVLDVAETAPETILFTDVLKKSFRHYAGSWRIVPGAERTTVLYRLEATPAFFSPDFLAVNGFRRNVEELLAELRSEIISRASS